MTARKLAFVGLAAAGGLLLLWLVGGNAYARYREKQVERDWAQGFGTRENLLLKYPKTTTNDTAQRLEKLVKPLGLDLSLKTREAISAGALASEKSRETEVERGLRAVSRYLTAELEKPEASIDTPPIEAKDFLSAHSRDLRTVEEEILASPPPSWAFDSSSLPNRQAIPNVFGLIRLHRVLLAEAFEETVNENAVGADRTLEASWRLNRTLREVPDVMCQLMALAVARLQVGALRKVEVDASFWRPRLAEHDFKGTVLDTQLLSAWPSAATHRELQEIESRSRKNVFQRLDETFEEPYGDIVWSQVLEKMRLSYLHVKDAPLLDKEIWAPGNPSRGNAADMIFLTQMPNLLDSFRRVDRLVIDSELTEKVLQARQLRQQNGGNWPAAIPGIEATRFPEAKWIYSVSPEGAMSLSLSKEPKWTTSGLVLPTRFTSS